MRAFATEAIHTSYDPDEHNRALMPPIYQNSMFALHEIGEDTPYRYARLQNPTRDILEKTIAQLELGTRGFAFSSGMAAIDAAWRTLLKPDDTIVATEDIYGGAFDLLIQNYQNWGVKVIFADLSDPKHLDRILQKETVKLLWLESPSNPLLKLTDIAALTEIAHKYGVLVGIDNTFATPYLQNPLGLGVDIVAHSATKYLCGHSDVLMGLLVTKDPHIGQHIHQTQVQCGAVAGPMDCSLVLRGIKTLALRMEKHQENALIIAEKMQAHPKIHTVFYPGLSTHASYELAQKQMKGAGGVVSIYLKDNTRHAANRLITHLSFIKLASSLGGIESLVNHSYSQSHSGMDAKTKAHLGIQEGLLRFSIGIEDAHDIWADIEDALTFV